MKKRQRTYYDDVFPVLAKATEDDMQKLIKTSPFEDEDGLYSFLMGIALRDMSPITFAQATGISVPAAGNIMSWFFACAMVPSFREEK